MHNVQCLFSLLVWSVVWRGSSHVTLGWRLAGARVLLGLRLGSLHLGASLLGHRGLLVALSVPAAGLAAHVPRHPGHGLAALARAFVLGDKI